MAKKKKPRNVMKREQRDRLYDKQRGKCYWCKRPMRKRWVHRDGVPTPDDIATLEHLDSRLSPSRGMFSQEIRHAVACRACNLQRGVAEEKGEVFMDQTGMEAEFSRMIERRMEMHADAIR